MGLVILIILLIACSAGFIKVSNTIKQLAVKVDEAESSIEIALVKRYDVLQSSYDVVKGYTKHEDKIFSQLVQVRRGLSISDMGDIATGQDKAVKSLVAVAEQYPTLKADTVFSNLQRQLTEENTHFAAAKRVYNSNVSLYNQYIVAFPASFVAGISGASKREFFAEDNVESKRDIKFEF